VAQRAGGSDLEYYEAGLSRTPTDGYCLGRRAERGLFGGLWELPTERIEIRRRLWLNHGLKRAPIDPRELRVDNLYT